LHTVEQLSIALGEKENEVIVAKKKQAGSLKVKDFSTLSQHLFILIF